MPFPLIPLALMGGSIVGGWLSGRGRTNTSSTSTTLPTEMGPLQQMLINRATDRLRTGSALPAGYETGGIKSINDTFSMGQQSLENTLSARGLSRSPIGGTPLTRMEGQRLGTIGNFRAGLPLLNRQLQQEDESGIMQMLANARGVSSTGTTPSNRAGGAADSLAQMLGFLYGQGIFNKMPVGGGGQMPYGADIFRSGLI